MGWRSSLPGRCRYSHHRRRGWQPSRMTALVAWTRPRRALWRVQICQPNPHRNQKVCRFDCMSPMKCGRVGLARRWVNWQTEILCPFGMRLCRYARLWPRRIRPPSCRKIKAGRPASRTGHREQIRGRWPVRQERCVTVVHRFALHLAPDLPPVWSHCLLRARQACQSPSVRSHPGRLQVIFTPRHMNRYDPNRSLHGSATRRSIRR